MSKGFSKYDDNGNVIYSQSILKNGGVVQHFYQYDSLERRIYYKRIDSEENSTFEEYTTYCDDGQKIIHRWDSKTMITTVMTYNSDNRLISGKIIDIKGFYKSNDYNKYTKKYDENTGRDLFYYNGGII